MLDNQDQPSARPRIAAVGTALPENVLRQRDIKAFVSHMFGQTFGRDIDRLIGIYDNSEIESRHFCMPLDWYAEEHSFREKNDLYIQHGLELSKRAIATCLDRAGLGYDQIDYLMFVSTTGLATPSMDARLIRDLPFGRAIRRLPIWGLGCAGGASSLSRAMDIACGNPDVRILIVVLELCGLTFMRNDLSKSALIATSLFADGAAAVLVEGAHAAPRADGGPELVNSQTTTLDDSLDVMGWEIGDDGFKVVISRDIPTIVKTFMKESIDRLLDRSELTLSDLMHYVAHPGGAKVINAYEESLGLTPDQLRHTRDVLRTCGNISACSVLFVLDRFIDEIAARRREGKVAGVEHGLLGALGPGFSAELVLLRWPAQQTGN
jgi:alkylresorcinol/alkylpyrone synthase